MDIKRPILNPNWITGFADGEGCFAINIYDRPIKKTPTVQFVFCIGLAERDFDVVKKIKEYFGGGFASRRKNKDVMDAYYGCSGTNLVQEKIIPHFDKYPLCSEKKKSYELWKQGIKIWQSDLPKKDKLLQLVAIRRKMNPKGRKKPSIWDENRILEYYKN